MKERGSRISPPFGVVIRDFAVSWTEEGGLVVGVDEEGVAFVDADGGFAVRRFGREGAEQGGAGDFSGDGMDVDAVDEAGDDCGLAGA